MTEKYLHIIAFDVPFPPDYGGVIDVYYRIKALNKLGVKIILHCYEYGRGMPIELEEITHEVHYYKRKKTIFDFLSPLPFIVRTRSSRQLIRRLSKDKYPILFEGLHTCYFLSDERLKNRNKIVRTHNIEHEYYLALSMKSKGWKKRFFQQEAKKLERFEQVLQQASLILTIKEKDRHHFSKYDVKTIVLQAACTDIGEMEYRETEAICLFQGNLSVIENEDAAIWLIKNVFKPIELTNKLIIAGKNPSDRLNQLCVESGVELVINPGESEMNELIQTARVHVLYSNQATGVKLKLINALQTSGHIIANGSMIKDTDFVDYCTLALIAQDFQYFVQQKLAVELSIVEFNERKEFVESNLNTLKNSEKLLSYL